MKTRKVNDYLFGHRSDEVTIGKLYMHWYKELFNSKSIQNVVIDVECFKNKLVKEFRLKQENILARYETVHFKPKRKNHIGYYDKQFFNNKESRTEIEYYIQICEKCLVGISSESFTMRYGHKIPAKKINRIIELHNQSKEKNPK